MKGFTLIETMVAITILTVAVAGTFSVANSSINASSIARDQLTASYFAQEGIEMVRQARDNTYLATKSFSLPDTSGSLYSTTYTPSSGKTVFTRTVTKTQMPNIVLGSIVGVEYRIDSKVTWSYHGITHSVTITDHLTSWQ
jgi:prepilin-type N-terminal cleavage/methylation domain-containing protein